MLQRYHMIAAVVILLEACASHQPENVDMSGPTSAPVPATMPPPEAGPMKAAELMSTLSGKTFRYTRGSKSGTISFAADGTFTYQEDGKGGGSGVWQASAGQLCQAFNPTTFLPKGTPSECYPFTRKDDAYAAGSASYRPS